MACGIDAYTRKSHYSFNNSAKWCIDRWQVKNLFSFIFISSERNEHSWHPNRLYQSIQQKMHSQYINNTNMIYENRRRKMPQKLYRIREMREIFVYICSLKLCEKNSIETIFVCVFWNKWFSIVLRSMRTISLVLFRYFFRSVYTWHWHMVCCNFINHT